MVSLRQRGRALEEVAMVMLEEGKVLTRHEYEKLGSVPVRPGIAMNFFGSWSRMLNLMENSLPGVWAEIKTKENPPPKSVSPKAPEPEVMVKPAVRPAVKKDKDDE